MSAKPLWSVQLTPTINLCEMAAGRGDSGLWLYDETRGMNLAMRAKTEREAFVKALTYYQKRLAEVETSHAALAGQVEAFVSLFPQFHTCQHEEN